MRRSTGQYVVLKKLAMGQTLYESHMSLNSSYVDCQRMDQGKIEKLYLRRGMFARSEHQSCLSKDLSGSKTWFGSKVHPL